MAVISQFSNNNLQRMMLPVKAYYFVTEVPSDNSLVQAVISNDNAEAFLEERQLNLDSSMPPQHPLANLRPALQIKMMNPVPSEDGSQHLEHMVTMHVPYMDLLKELFQKTSYSCAVTTGEDNNKWILTVALANDSPVQNPVFDSMNKFSSADLMQMPMALSANKEAIRSCLDHVMAYELSMEKKVGPLETVQQMTTAVIACRGRRAEACKQVLMSLAKTDVVPELPLQWSRFLGNAENGDAVCMDPQQVECMIKGSVLGALQPQLMIFNLNACATVAVQIAQAYGVDCDNIRELDHVVAHHVKNLPKHEFRNAVLMQIRDELISNAKYTGDPSWTPKFSVNLLPNQRELGFQNDGSMLAKVNVKMVKGTDPGEDQTIPGFTAEHLLMQKMNFKSEETEKTMKFHFDCEDSAAFLAAAAASWNLPEEVIRNSVASTCALLPPTISDLQPTLMNMMLLLKEQPITTLKDEFINLQKLDRASFLSSVAEAKTQEGNYNISTTALLAKAPSIGDTMVPGKETEKLSKEEGLNYSADMFNDWWHNQPLGGHAIVTSANVKHVMSVQVGDQTVHIKMLGDNLRIFEGTGPAFQVESPVSQQVTVNFDTQPSTDMRRNLQKKLKNQKLNVTMASNLKSSLHVTELQNVLLFKNVAKGLQQQTTYGLQQNAQNNIPAPRTQLTPRQVFSLNCAAKTASERAIATQNSFYITLLSRGAEGVAYTVDTSTMRPLVPSAKNVFFGGSLIKGLIDNSETIMLHSEMSVDEQRRCMALGALSAVTMLPPEILIPNLPIITSRQMRQKMRVDPNSNTIFPLTPHEIATTNLFSCGILKQESRRISEQEMMDNIKTLCNEAVGVIGCTPVVQCNGFSSAFYLTYS
jgi:hypothetical protein